MQCERRELSSWTARGVFVFQGGNVEIKFSDTDYSGGFGSPYQKQPGQANPILGNSVVNTILVKALDDAKQAQQLPKVKVEPMWQADP